MNPGDNVLVIGAGPIGIMHMQLAHVMGARQVVAIARHPERMRLFPQEVADLVFDPETENLRESILESTSGKGFDVIVVAAPSSDAQALAVDLANVHARINFFGGLPKDEPTTTIDANRIHYMELIITGTTGQTISDFRESMTLVANGLVNLSGLITERYPLSMIEEAIRVAKRKQGLKILVLPSKQSN
jgi:L-iditol 2-dehydrogenase